MDKDKRKIPKFLELALRYKYVLLVAVLGVILLLWPTKKNGGAAGTGAPLPEAAAPDNSLEDTERALEEILGKISGVGRAEVMLTLNNGGEKVLAQNDTLRYSGSVQSPDSYDRSSETVTLGGNGGGEVVVTQERCPQYRGALVVCDGGGNDRVRLQVIEAVSVLTGLGTDRISVVKSENLSS